VKKTLLVTLLCFTVLSLCTFGFAADKASRPGYASTVVGQAHPYVDTDAAALRVLFSNFGPDPADLYDATNGYFVSGPNNTFNAQMQDIAIPFVARANANVVGIKYAIQEYLELGVAGFKASLNADAAGLPGASLASADVRITAKFGDPCCALTTWKLKTPVAVTKGTQYWVVGTTDAKTKDAINTWSFVYNDAPGTFAFQQPGTGWILLTAANGYPPSAVAVYAQ
jgi:hypothetical protein